MGNRKTPIKKWSQSCYQRKIDKITDWYNCLLKFREKEPKINSHNNLPYKRKELKSLEWYLEKIKKPIGEQRWENLIGMRF